MESTNNYQQDTIKVINQLNAPDSIGRIELNIPPAQFLLRPIETRDTLVVKSTPKAKNSEDPKVITQSQLRQWWWRRDQKLLVGNSRYINTKDDVELLFTEKKVDNNLALPNHKFEEENTDWLTMLLIAILVLFATVRTKYSIYMSSLFKSIINYSTAARMFEEKNYSVTHAAFRLEIYFYLTFSVFLFQVFKYFNLELPYRNFGLFLFCLGLVLVYFFSKKLTYSMIGMIVENENETGEYLFNADNVNRVMGLILFPIVLLIAFYPGENTVLPVTLGIIITIILYFVLLFRGMMILLKKQFSIYYLFLYFCTLEFLPLVLLYKIVVL